MDGTDDVALLVVRCQLGEREALRQLVKTWHTPLWNYLRRMAGSADNADDLAQDAWVGVFRGLPGLREPERFAPWLFTIARRVVMNRLREEYAEQRDAEAGAGWAESGAGRPEAGSDDITVDRLELLAGLADLPVIEREVLVLFHLQDLSLRDCAQVLQIPEGTVKSRLFRARQMLRSHLLGKGFSHDR
ncbi:RNA polymerase sigma factor [Actinomadura sp. HBU206391]|uniref:RNA polymerase sigma factor n=1 Tax=Actinomadura sp. HBU206391 TaxID=2731692 RepID=UPI00164EEEC7|nr:RNA polymerase sigma factor [Actinomadura sp. HBU206391]MBC6457268.1 RNA polymerase sigma factor [Actinomadura sp. HBU206391]